MADADWLTNGGGIVKITEVRIKKLASTNTGKVRAFATITLDGVLVIHNIRIVDGKDGLFIAMPCRKIATGEYKDVVHPIDTPLRKYFQDTILKAYEDVPEESVALDKSNELQ